MSNQSPLDVTIITGMSGAGRSEAAHVLEDLGFFVIDNMPPSLISKVAELALDRERPVRYGLVVDVRSGDFLAELRAARAELAIDGRACASSSSTRPTRCSSAATKRAAAGIRSPLPIGSATASRTSASCSKSCAARPTSSSTRRTSTSTSCASACGRASPTTRPTRACRRASCRSATSTACRSTSTSCSTAASFPTRTGSRRCGRSPGVDEPVRQYVLAQPETGQFLAELDRMFALLLPRSRRERKSYLSIGVGCTGGQHRSVVMAEELARLLAARGYAAKVHHRDVDRA